MVTVQLHAATLSRKNQTSMTDYDIPASFVLADCHAKRQRMINEEFRKDYIYTISPFCNCL